MDFNVNGRIKRGTLLSLKKTFNRGVFEQRLIEIHEILQFY